ncbi:MAG: hypothetical protein F4Y03_12810 [Alphaproteobacteria bacterium]|nr:hypothetical protein [Alphaproteobacteria bacterium]
MASHTTDQQQTGSSQERAHRSNVRAADPVQTSDGEARLRLLDAATERQWERQESLVLDAAGYEYGGRERGWTRDELYRRGGPDAD